MRAPLFLLMVLTLSLRAWASTENLQPLKFERVIDGATIVASGKTVALRGVKPPDSSDPVAYASRRYLETMLGHGALRCADKSAAGGRQVMKCYIDTADVGSLVVQMGMGTAADSYYLGEEAIAREKRRGLWRR